MPMVPTGICCCCCCCCDLQDAVSRTTALRGALGQLHGQLEELRTDHAALQDAHRALVAKDLMKSGLLKDRWVDPVTLGWSMPRVSPHCVGHCGAAGCAPGTLWHRTL